MKKLVTAIALSLSLAACGGGGSDEPSDYWTPAWMYKNCLGVSTCIYKSFDTKYETEKQCMASPEVTLHVGMPFHAEATCLHTVALKPL